MVSVKLWIAPIDYDYESSTDAGDGRDDYSKEETNLEIDPNTCIVKDGTFFGLVCNAFDKEDFILTTNSKTCISHPYNYSGKGCHFYRNMFFELLRK